MLYKIKTVNGQKQKIPLTSPSGLPVGTIISRYKKICPKNCVYLDGRDTTGTAEELETVYPALYMFLGGTNVLPDYRECGLVGAEQNTTDTIATHDVYAEGQFKDDQLQEHKHSVKISTVGSGGTNTTDYTTDPDDGTTETRYTLNVANARTGTTTHGKQKAVYYYMVAVEGVQIADEDDFINVVKAYIDNVNSYSTEEHFTGRYWIDGKKIYGKTFTESGTNTGQNTHGINVSALLNTVDRITLISSTYNCQRYIFSSFNSSNENNQVFIDKDNGMLYYQIRFDGTYTVDITVEYTKS